MAQTILKVTKVGAEFAAWAIKTDKFCKGADATDLVYVQSSSGHKTDAVYPSTMAKRILKDCQKHGAQIIDEAGLGF